ncbi:MAG: hypothetical protein O3C20_00530 [Verrucomicrobia bacterium]|nr:hypothetical protein [Verrucomicrobiota bacterium]
MGLFWQHNGKNFAAEFKYGDAPRRSKAMTAALNDLKLDHFWIIYPGAQSYPVGEKIIVQSISEIQSIFI